MPKIRKSISILSLFIIVSIFLFGVQPASALHEDSPKQRVVAFIDNNVSLQATDWYVTTNGSDTNSCTDSASPCLTINGAIGKASEGDIIYVATGIYTNTITEVVWITKSITLSGGWDVTFTTQEGFSTLDGQNTRRGITAYAASVIVDRFKIQNGFDGSGGGGLINFGTLTLNNSIVTNNISLEGGGIENSNNGTLTINNTTISNNRGELSGNSGNGGGIVSFSGTVTLNNSTINNNSSPDGSGIQNSFGIFVINNSTISDNSGGRAISNILGTMSLNNSTVYRNSGGGITNSGNGAMVLQNSIVAKNVSSNYGDCSGIIGSSGYNLIGSTSGCSFSTTTGDLVGIVNPLIAPLQDNGGLTQTNGLMSGSPAIGAGSPAQPGSGGNACLATDQRGTSRPVGARCNIGAFEGQVPEVFITIAGNVGLPGVTLNYRIGTDRTSTSDANGDYLISVPAYWTGYVRPFKAGYTFSPSSRNYDNVSTNQIAQNYSGTVLIVPFPVIQDPSFEIPTPNPYWSVYSLNFGTPWCLQSICGYGGGTSGPRSGLGWIWLGGSFNNEVAQVSQTLNISSGFPDLKLQFYLWIGLAQPGSDAGDVFTAKIDNVPVFSANATDQNIYPTYKPVLVDLKPFANDQTHTITFTGITTTQVVNFNLDDVNLVNVKFLDVPSDFWALQFVERLYNAGITGGCSVIPLKYCPDNTVTRAQMAVFLLKGMHGASYTPSALGSSTGFSDVPTDHWAAAWIKQLAAENITSGCGNGNYCPETTVTRDQMAIFLLKAKHGPSYSPPNATGVFTDVPMGYWADKWIEQLATEGITGGCGAGVYCPTNSVTRAQMAVFLVKAFNLP